MNIRVRDDYYTLLEKHGLSPRLSISKDLDNNKGLSASGSLVQQFPDMFRLMELVDSDSGYALTELNLQRAWIGAIGYQQSISSVVRLVAEAYAKWYDREPRYNIELIIHTTRTVAIIAVIGLTRLYGCKIIACM